jgi:hypothetical protein
MDDDIVLLDTPDAFRSYIQFRIDNPQFFVIYGNILNNAIVSYIQQHYGKLDNKAGIAGYSCMDEVGWRSSDFAINLHNQVLAHPLSHYYFNNHWELLNNEKISINCICWFGSEFAKFGGNILSNDDEQYLSHDKPSELKMLNCIYGLYTIVHFAFYPQKHDLEASGLLKYYKERVEKDAKLYAHTNVSNPNNPNNPNAFGGNNPSATQFKSLDTYDDSVETFVAGINDNYMIRNNKTCNKNKKNNLKNIIYILLAVYFLILLYSIVMMCNSQ